MKGNRKLSGFKKIDIVLVLILVVGYTLFHFKAQIGTAVVGIKYKSPVVWNNVKINFPRGMTYEIDHNSVTFSHWENKKGFVYLRKTNRKARKENILEFLRKKGFQIIETSDTTFKGLDAFTVSYTESESKIGESRPYTKAIYVFAENMIIDYTGEKAAYDSFKDIIDGIEFQR